jgi:hypothetical protein
MALSNTPALQLIFGGFRVILPSYRFLRERTLIRRSVVAMKVIVSR